MMLFNCNSLVDDLDKRYAIASFDSVAHPGSRLTLRYSKTDPALPSVGQLHDVTVEPHVAAPAFTPPPVEKPATVKK